MAEQNEPNKNDKAVEEKPDITKTTEYRRFKRLLKQVIKSSPMRKGRLEPRPR
jgi:hypothetical protein